jgi:hypothetical protein
MENCIINYNIRKREIECILKQYGPKCTETSLICINFLNLALYINNKINTVIIFNGKFCANLKTF